MMHTDVDFPAGYDAQVVEEQPNGDVSYVFGREDRPAAGTEVMVKVEPQDGDRWVGAVRRSPRTVTGVLTGIHPTPNPTRVCILAGGDAYLIDVYRPADYQALNTGGPVVGVYPVISDRVLLLTSPWVVTAVDQSGSAWQTDRLAVNGLRLDEVTAGRIAGVADPDNDEPRDFWIDVRTGRHEGGTPF